jgi:hypothetical protein
MAFQQIQLYETASSSDELRIVGIANLPVSSKVPALVDRPDRVGSRSRIEKRQATAAAFDNPKRIRPDADRPIGVGPAKVTIDGEQGVIV